MVLVLTFLFFVWECLSNLQMWWICCISSVKYVFFPAFCRGGLLFCLLLKSHQALLSSIFDCLFSFSLFYLQLLEWGRLWEATCQWCLGPQWWDLLPVPWWCPPGQEWLDQTDKEIGEPLYISFILLHQEIMVLWLGMFSNRMTRKTCSPFLSKSSFGGEWWDRKSNFHLYCEMWK